MSAICHPERSPVILSEAKRNRRISNKEKTIINKEMFRRRYRSAQHDTQTVILSVEFTLSLACTELVEVSKGRINMTQTVILNEAQRREGSKQ